MKDKFEMGIEISKEVVETAAPERIKRYDIIPKKKIKIAEEKRNRSYRYRPGVNFFMNGDLDV